MYKGIQQTGDFMTLEHMSIEQIKTKLKASLSHKRFEHSLGVMDTAVKLAEKYDEEAGKAAVAGLLHDCARNVKGDDLFRLCERFGITVDMITKAQPELLHGSVGACIAEEEYGITDEAVLSAIRFHTMGRKNMSILEKIIFVADYIEPDRSFPGVAEVREAAFRCLDTALLMSLDSTVKHVISKGILIHPDAIDARNYLVFQKNSQYRRK
jgi:predicted HD superfamily hydrolase involved in NAD metabolism